MAIIVQKYGGSSVATLEHMQHIAKRVIQSASQGNRIVLVVSAMGKTTNELLELAHQAQHTPEPREVDALLSTGEQKSVALMAMVLNGLGQAAISLTGFQAGIRTVGRHMRNKIGDIDVSKVLRHLDAGKIVVVAGFQGFNDSDDITTLGRGGSDTTAVALAAKLGCVCEIYTDVDGIYSTDPRRFSRALRLDQISYEEMKEMSHLGAKVMEPRSVEIGHRYHVPIWVKHSQRETQGTLIKEYDVAMEERSITGITIADDVLMVTLSGLLYEPEWIANVFEALAREDVLVDMISQTSPVDGYLTLSFTAAKADMVIVQKVLSTLTEGIEVRYNDAISKVSVVGMGMRTQTGIAAKIFRAFSEHKIAFMQVSTSEISISYTMAPEMVSLAVHILSELFELEDQSEERMVMGA